MNNADEDIQSSVNPIQQSEVTAKNGNKSAASKNRVMYDTLSDTRHFPREKRIGLRNIC